ncbi:MAG: PAS domain S-box protein, partial [Gemmatimonadetes bacterium]|nr:PAS domain S-box protein [Gemmatimonadota bacterium]
MTSFRHLPGPTIQSREAVDLEESSPESYLFFNETTRKYVQAYRQLEEQFEYLDAKLEETNNQLRQSLEEKDRVSKYLNNILESMSGGVLVLDLEGRITLFNQAAEEITGRSQEEVLGRRYEEVMGENGGGGKSALFTLDSGTGLQTQEKELKRSDGRTIPLGFSSSLVRDHNGEVLGALEAFNDLTEVKRLEAQVQRMNTLAALGEMAATVAHEIRNPLGGIASFANLLERDLDSGDPNRRLVSKITEGVARLNRIVSSLLSYTRPLN